MPKPKRSPIALKEPKLIRIRVDQILENPENPRDHDQEQIRLLKKSLEHYGIVALPILNRDRRLLAGHGRIQALKALGHGAMEIPVLEVDLSEEDCLGYIVMDNRSTDMSTWRFPELKQILTELDTGAWDLEWSGYTEEAMKNLFPEDDGPPAPLDPGPGDGPKGCTCPNCGFFIAKEPKK